MHPLKKSCSSKLAHLHVTKIIFLKKISNSNNSNKIRILIFLENVPLTVKVIIIISINFFIFIVLFSCDEPKELISSSASSNGAKSSLLDECTGESITKLICKITEPNKHSLIQTIKKNNLNKIFQQRGD